MGKLYLLDGKGKREFTVFSKKAFKKIEKLGKVMPEFAFNYSRTDTSVYTYYDSPSRLLKTAGVIFSKVVKGDHAVFRIDSTRPPISKYEKKVYVPKRYTHEISAEEKVIEHLYFLTEGIESVLYSKVSIDLENVLKSVVPLLIISIKRKKFLVSNGTGFKAEIAFEYATYDNLETKRKATDLFLRVKNLTPKDEKLDLFEQLVSDLLIFEKELIVMSGSKYDIANTVTKAIEVKKKED